MTKTTLQAGAKKRRGCPKKGYQKVNFELNLAAYSGNIIQAIKNDGDKIIAWRVSAVVDEQMKEGIIDVQDITTKLPIKEGVPCPFGQTCWSFY